MRIGIAVSALCKVAVERCNDAVAACGGICVALPLSDTWTASVCHDDGTGFFKDLQDTIALCSFAD
jgi:hypothetical protein